MSSSLVAGSACELRLADSSLVAGSACELRLADSSLKRPQQHQQDLFYVLVYVLYFFL